MKSSLLDYLSPSANRAGIALESGIMRIGYEELLQRAERLALALIRHEAKRVALYMDNGIDWIVSDLACQLADLLLVPLPLFFSEEQIQHALASAGIDTVIADRDIRTIIPNALPLSGGKYRLHPPSVVPLPDNTQKITFTSGTTGTPKGVCLSSRQQLTLAESLASVINIPSPRHLCVLPLSTLLENLAGVYTPLITGGTVIVPPLFEVGISGSSGLAVEQMLSCIDQYQPDSLILVPELLNALVLAANAGWQPPETLQFVAVGGGKVSPERIRAARRFGIPAYEGYGLSENASVVSLNVPNADRVGSVGKPLPHVNVQVKDNELVVSGNAFLGYIEQPESWGADILHTGDTGYIDNDGFVHVNGRIKNQIISSFGRNISPEWVESELLAGPLLQQAVIVGDNRPYCVALFYPRDPAVSDEQIEKWLRNVNQDLPDYARIVRWHRLQKPLAENGRLNRARLEKTYQFFIDDMYEPRKEASNA